MRVDRVANVRGAVDQRPVEVENHACKWSCHVLSMAKSLRWRNRNSYGKPGSKSLRVSRINTCPDGGAELTRFLSPTCGAMQGIATLTRQWPEAVGPHAPPTFADMTMMVSI